jgi:hypothetical protein
MSTQSDLVQGGFAAVIAHMRRTGLDFHKALADLERRGPGSYARMLRKAEAAAAPAEPEAGCALAPNPSATHEADSHSSQSSRTRTTTLAEGTVF